MLFTDFRNSKQFLRYDRSKSEATTGSLWEAQTKTAKKDYFTKILSPPRFFEINTSNFKDMFLNILRKFFGKEFPKNLKKIIKKNNQKKQFFFVLLL